MLQFLFNDTFYILQQFPAIRQFPVLLPEPLAVPPDKVFRLAATDTLVIGFAPGCEPLSPPAIESVPAVLLQVAVELGLAVRGVLRGTCHGIDDTPVRLERLLPGAEPPEQVVDYRHLVTEHETQPGLVEREPFKGSRRPSVFAPSGHCPPHRPCLSRFPSLFHLVLQ